MGKGNGSDLGLSGRVVGKLLAANSRITPQVFGQIAQSILVSTFDAGGYQVTTPNTIGVPDFVAVKLAGGTRLAVEAKTGDPISLTLRDLEGTINAGEVAIIAALVFPDRRPRWLFADAGQLRPGRWELRRLERLPQVDLGFDVQRTFLKLVDTVREELLSDRPAFQIWSSEQRRMGWVCLSDA
jgi:hypothetical protein